MDLPSRAFLLTSLSISEMCSHRTQEKNRPLDPNAVPKERQGPGGKHSLLSILPHGGLPSWSSSCPLDRKLAVTLASSLHTPTHVRRPFATRLLLAEGFKRTRAEGTV